MAFNLVYTDPPWTQSNISAFYTKAGFPEKRPPIDTLLAQIAALLRDHLAGVAFLEIGKQKVETFQQILANHEGHVLWTADITYYGKKPCKLIAVAFNPAPEHRALLDEAQTGLDALVSGKDDEKTPDIVFTQLGEYATGVADLCIGRGLTARTASKHFLPCYGVELHPRRLAWVLDFHANRPQAVEVERITHDTEETR